MPHRDAEFQRTPAAWLNPTNPEKGRDPESGHRLRRRHNQFGVRDALTAFTCRGAPPFAAAWVFDDERAGLHREPFVAGIPEMIDEIVKDIPDANEGFRLFFSTIPFPGHTHKLVWRR